MRQLFKNKHRGIIESIRLALCSTGLKLFVQIDLDLTQMYIGKFK